MNDVHLLLQVYDTSIMNVVQLFLKIFLSVFKLWNFNIWNKKRTPEGSKFYRSSSITDDLE